jgi:hypothetical protein
VTHLPAEPQGRERLLPALMALVLAAGCAMGPVTPRDSTRPSAGGPTGDQASGSWPPSASTTLPSATVTPVESTTPQATAGGSGLPGASLAGLPSLLIVGGDPADPRLWLTRPEAPTVRVAVTLAGGWRPEAATTDGGLAFLATRGPAAIRHASLVGEQLHWGPALPLPVALALDGAESLRVACRSTSGDVLVSDGAAVLHLVHPDGRPGRQLPAETLGSCSWTDPERVVFDVEGSHHLGRWRVGASDVAMTGLALGGPSAAGLIVAALSDDAGASRAFVIRLAAAPRADGGLDAETLAILLPGTSQAYAGVRLSGDARWLVAWGGPVGEAVGWLDLYQLRADGYLRTGRIPLGANEMVLSLLDEA